MNSEIINLELYLHRETDKAILVSDDGNSENAVWLPKSQVGIERKTSNTVVVTLPEWLAIERGLI